MFGVEWKDIEEARARLEEKKERERQKDQEAADAVAFDLLKQCAQEIMDEI